MKQYVYYTMLVFLSIFCAACVSNKRDISRFVQYDSLAALLEVIEEDFTNGNVEHAMALAHRGYSEERISAEQLSQYKSRAYTTLLQRYDDAEAQEDFAALRKSEWNIRYLQEFVSAEPKDVVLDTQDNILLRWADSELAKDNAATALHILLLRSILGDLPADTLLRYLSVARKLNHYMAVKKITHVMNQREISVPNAPSGFTKGNEITSEMLKGTVTVWVDMGIQLENGIGVPSVITGSGFFIDYQGHLLTNYHVIASEVDPTYEGYSRLFIKLPDRDTERVPARVIGYDSRFDIALLKVEITPEYVFSLSSFPDLEPGTRVYALGSPGGLDSTITSGIVSTAKRRSPVLAPYIQMGEAIQVDAPINPGNSGGPLLLPSGEVVGVVFGSIDEFEGVNFAVPAHWILHFFPRLFHEGQVVHPWLGVAVHEVKNGLQVLYVVDNSPADHAGVHVGDILRAIGNTYVSSISMAQDIILSFEADYFLDTLWELKAAEGGEVQTVRRLMVLDKRPFSPVEESLEHNPIDPLLLMLFGMEVEKRPEPFQKRKYVITNIIPGSIADETGFSINDPIVLLNWGVETNYRLVYILLSVKKRKAGFLESRVQLQSFLETNTFL